MGKKPYVKPMIVIENYKTGELIGSPEMMEKIVLRCKQEKNHEEIMACPLDEANFGGIQSCIKPKS